MVQSLGITSDGFGVVGRPTLNHQHRQFYSPPETLALSLKPSRSSLNPHSLPQVLTLYLKPLPSTLNLYAVP